MSADQLMYIVRFEGIEDEAEQKHSEEYEVIADAETIGEFRRGVFYFTFWELTSGNARSPGNERALCLRVEHPMLPGPEEWETATARGYYHGGGAADEVVILSSLFLRRRFRLDRVVRWNGLPRMYDTRHRGGPVISEVTAGAINLETLNQWFDLIRHLDPAVHQRFILSAKFYQQALLQSERDPTSAYLSLVSAVEVLSGDFEVGEADVTDVDPTLAELFARVEDENLRHDLIRATLKRDRRVSRRFREFVIYYVDESFYRQQDEDRLRTISPAELPDLLKRVYDHRSRLLHAGEPLPPYIERGPHRGEELPLGLELMSGARRWDVRNKPIPLLHAFERLTRHVLLNYLYDKCGIPRQRWPKDAGANTTVTET